MEGKKKTLLLSILAVIVLVVAVAGVAYAMFSFSATGTKVNQISTGYVTMDFAEASNLSVTNALPIAASSVVENANNTMTFSVNATINGDMIVYYDLGFDSNEFDVTSSSGSPTLSEDDIKFRLYKSTTSGTFADDPILDDVTIGSRATEAGFYANSTNDSVGTGLDSYAIDSGYFTATGTKYYKLVAWLDEDYELKTGTLQESTTTVETGDHSEVTHSQGTISETFTFKLKVVAGQANPNTSTPVAAS